MNSPAPRILSAALALLTPLASIQAADYTWNLSGSGDWDTTSPNWSGSGSTWINGSGNTATFNAFAATTTIALTTNITAGTLSNSSGSTIVVNGSGSLDVPTINTNGAFFDMSVKLTGNHGLTYNGAGGRLNMKTAADYTGDTILTGNAYLLLDGNPNNLLPTGTTLTMDRGTTFRLAKAAASQELAGLASTTTGTGTATVTNTVTSYSLKLNTKTSTTTTFSGTISSSAATNLLNLEISGSGTQALNGTTSFYGTTTVSGGTLSLGGNLTNNTAVTVSGGALTSSVANVNLGTGAVSISSGEISARGNAAAGTFTLAANQNFTATGGKLTFNIGTALDQLKGSGTGTFSIGSGTEVALILGTGFSYASTYQLFDSFAGGSVAGTGVSITGYDTANWTAALSNTGVLSFAASSIPEPSTYAALAGAAFLGFATLRRRRSS